MGLMSNDLVRLSPAAQKQVMEKMQKPGKYKAQKTKRGKLTFDSKKEAERYDTLMLLQKYAKDGWRILDTHLGSGSSRIAAYNLGFEFVGCEIEPTYFQLQEQRFAEHTAQERLW